MRRPADWRRLGRRLLYPHPAVVDCLRRNTDAIWMYLNDLPEELSFPPSR